MRTQQPVVVNAMTSQQPEVVDSYRLSEDMFYGRQKVILLLGIMEVFAGFIMIGFGIYTLVQFNTWQAIWIGIWVSSAGSLGIQSGGTKSTPCLINTHMGFSIVGAIASVSLAYLTGEAAHVSIQIPSIYAIMAIMSFISSATAVVLIVSASYCGCSNPLGCCGGCSGGCCGQLVFSNEQYQQQVVYATQPAPIQRQAMYDPRCMNGPYGNPMPAASTNLPEKNYSLNTQYSPSQAYVDAQFTQNE